MNVQHPNTTIIIPRADDVGFRDVAGGRIISRSGKEWVGNA